MDELEKDEERVLEFIKNQPCYWGSVTKNNLAQYDYYITKLADLSEQYWEKYFDEYTDRINNVFFIIMHQESLLEEFYEKKLFNNYRINQPELIYEKNFILECLIEYKRISENCIKRHPEIFDEEFWKYLYKNY